jgi:hypothetical protein
MIALIVAILLSIILFPIGFIVSMFYPKRGKYLYKIALGIDQLGNIVCARLFNFFLIDLDGYQFGDEDETISSVIGKNKGSGISYYYFTETSGVGRGWRKSGVPNVIAIDDVVIGTTKVIVIRKKSPGGPITSLWTVKPPYVP